MKDDIEKGFRYRKLEKRELITDGFIFLHKVGGEVFC